MRVRVAIAAVAVVLPVAAGLAAAEPLPPRLHSADVNHAVTGSVTSLRVEGHVTSLTLVPAKAASVRAHLEWTMERPTVTVTADRGALKVTSRCNDNVISGPGVYVGGFGDCDVDLRISVPTATSITAVTYAALAGAGFSGPLDLRAASAQLTDIRTSRLRVNASSAIRLDRIHATSLHVVGGAVTANRVTSRAASITSDYGSIQVADASARSLVVSAASGSARLTRARASLVDVASSYGAVAATDVVADDVRVESDSGAVSVERIGAARVTARSGYGSVSASQVRSRSVALRSSSGRAAATDVTADDLRVETEYGDVSAERVTAPRFTARSGSGDVVLRRVTSDTVSASTTNGRAAAADVVADHLSLRTDSGAASAERVSASVVTVRSEYGDVLVSRVRAARSVVATTAHGAARVADVETSDLRVETENGAVAAHRVTSPVVTARSGYGNVDVAEARAQRVTATSASGRVVLHAATAPTLARATSGYGAVEVAVPSGRYAVDASSGSGAVSVAGVTVDDRAPRQIVATSAQGDVNVRGF